MQETVNIFTADPIEDRIDLSALAGSSETAAYVYDVGPGEGSCPYHYEYVEEWMLVVSGEATVRTPEGLRTLVAGQLVRFAAGPEGAHKISNRGSAPCRVMLFSEARAPAISVYPDSDKIAVWPTLEESGDELIAVRSSAVSWSHGEDGWNRAD